MTAFLPKTLDVYGLTENDPRLVDYLSDEAMNAATEVNRDCGWKVTDKSLLSWALEPFEQYLVPTYGAVWDGTWEPIDLNISLDRLLGADHGILVKKPIFGSAGKNVELIPSNGGYTAESFLAKYDMCVLTGYAQQAKYAATIWPESANTVRVLTMHEPGRRAIIAGQVHRFGRKGTGCVDNWNMGGASAEIDMFTGVLGPIVWQNPVTRDRVEQDCHPNSGAQIAGVQVPRWRELCTLAKQMADHLTEIPYLAWDFVVTPGKPVLIETNSDPGVRCIQAHGGLLRNDKAKRFYEWAGVL